MFESKFDITKLMDKPIWQMCGEEFVLLAEFAFSQNSLPARQEPQTQFVYGISSLAEYLGCGNSTVYALKKEGVLDGAIRSRVGKRIVFDGPLARQLADDYKRRLAEGRSQMED